MPLVRLDQNGDISIPADALERIGAREGDVFEIAVADGAIVLRPQHIARAKVDAPVTPKGVDISRWIGAGRSGFKTADEADAFIRRERDSWD